MGHRKSSARGDTTAGETLDRSWLLQRLGFKLGKFATRIDRTDVTLRDENGPTGAPTFRAANRLQLPHREPIAAAAAHPSECVRPAYRR
jgi:hypothetical protein